MILLLHLELIVRWAKNFYEFRENEIATVELVTDSQFEGNVSITGNPRRIPDSDPTHHESLEVLGPPLFAGNGESKMNDDAQLYVASLYPCSDPTFIVTACTFYRSDQFFPH